MTRELPNLKRQAREEYPNVAKTDFAISIDYTKVPAVYSVFPLSEYEERMPVNIGSANSAARNEAIIERIRDNPGQFTAIRSLIPNGRTIQMALTMAIGPPWDEGPGNQLEWYDEEVEDDLD